MGMQEVSFTLNGKAVTMSVDIRDSLADLLRNKLQLTGLKVGCGVGECGACTVLVDGSPIDSCIYLAVWANGKDIRTVEGEAKDGKLSEVQQAFLDEGATQCGFCIPGFIMTATALVESDGEYTIAEIKKELSGNMCRCTGYNNIVKATDSALKKHKCNCKQH